MGNGARECEWCHAPEARGGFWEIWKSQLVELKTRHQTRRVDFQGSQKLTNLRATGAARDGGGRWKSQNRKNVYLSPYVKEPLNSKVIKSFIPELRSRKCFLCFEIPLFYVYICYEHYMYVSYTQPYHGYTTVIEKVCLHGNNM